MITSPENTFCKINLGILKTFDNLCKCVMWNGNIRKWFLRYKNICDSDRFIQTRAILKFIQLKFRFFWKFHSKCYASNNSKLNIKIWNINAASNAHCWHQISIISRMFEVSYIYKNKWIENYITLFKICIALNLLESLVISLFVVLLFALRPLAFINPYKRHKYINNYMYRKY